MANERSRCYFVYCWENDYSVIKRIKERVVKQSNNRVEVILDRQSFQVASSINHCESQIVNSDSVVVFFSPEYKKIISEGDANRGVYREYQYIKNKFMIAPNSIIPVLLKGKREDAITPEFFDSICSDLTALSFEKNDRGRVVITRGRESLRQLVDNIISITENMKRIREPVFDGIDDKIQKLLLTNASEGNLPKECIVDLKVYDDMFSQRNSFVMGRKGSGKTTILEVMERRDPKLFAERYKTLYPIYAEEIEMEALYALLQINGTDMGYFDTGSVLKTYWGTCLLLYGVYVVTLEEYYGRITDSRRNTFRKVGKRIIELTNLRNLDDGSMKRSLLNLCAEHISNYMHKESLNYVNENVEYTITQVKASFSAYNMLCGILGESLFETVATAIAACHKKVIIALDGFDTHSEDFRRMTNNFLHSEPNHELGVQRREFECLFYRSLIEVIREARTTKGDGSAIGKLFGMFDYYIVFPRDRYDQIRSVDRDIAKYNFINLQWDAVELITLANLRLEYIYDIKPSTNMEPKDRFAYLIKRLFPKIPSEVNIEIMNQTFRVDLFQYILSMSFWNPRDILAHIAALSNAYRQGETQQSIVPDQNTIRRIISNTAETIIEKELYKEFCEVFLNIREVMNQFRGKTLSMTVDDFSEIISCTVFRTNYEYECNNLEQKIRLLYELGIVGVRFLDQNEKKWKLGANICFVFNEGMKPINTILSDLHMCKNICTFVFNPILIEHLSLVDNVLKVIGNYGWDYLEQNHLAKEIIHQM